MFFRRTLSVTRPYPTKSKLFQSFRTISLARLVVEFAAANSRPVGTGVTDGIISPMASSTKMAFGPATTLAREVVERRSRPVGTGVTDGTRTRNSQNHNLELYH